MRPTPLAQQAHCALGRSGRPGARAAALVLCGAGELAATGAAVVGTACPFCQTMFRDAFGAVAQTPPKLLDIAQIAAASLESLG